MNTFDKVKADVDDGLYALKKDIQSKYKLSWIESRDMVNQSVKEMYGVNNKELIRKEIVFVVMRDLKATPLFTSLELRCVRTALNKNIPKVLLEEK